MTIGRYEEYVFCLIKFWYQKLYSLILIKLVIYKSKISQHIYQQLQ